MKIVMVHNLQRGGAHRRMSEQVAHLDLPVTEVTFEGSDPVTSNPVVVPLVHRGSRPHPIARPVTRYLDLLSLMQSYRQLGEVVRQHSPDVIWMNPCHILQSMWLPEDLAQQSVYYCDEPRRTDYEVALKGSTKIRTRVPYWPLRRISRHLDRSTIAHIPTIATNSTYTAGQIQQAYGRQSEVVRCGVSAQFRPPVADDPRDHLLSVGSLIPTKGHDLVITAAGRSGLGLPVLVASHRSDPLEEARLHEIAQKVGVALAIRIGVSDDELVELYQTARVTLYLSHAEPFGLVSTEAQACGSPVIVSDEGGLPETILPGITGWAVARDPDRVAEKLATFADVRVAARFGDAAAAHASMWSWSESAGRLRTLMSELAER